MAIIELQGQRGLTQQHNDLEGLHLHNLQGSLRPSIQRKGPRRGGMSLGTPIPARGESDTKLIYDV